MNVSFLEKIHSRQGQAKILLVLLPVFQILFFGCVGGVHYSTSVTSTSPSATPTSSTSPSPGPSSATILFQATNPGGSFNSPDYSNGTTNAVGSGLQAQRVFNTNGTLLSSGGYGSANWPLWLKSFEIGISGQSNSASSNSSCATFASSQEAQNQTCNLPNGTKTCGAPPAQFRISEADCVLGTPASANTVPGSSTDGIYMRATFDRSQFYTWENLMMVIQYTASALNPSPTSPTSCFNGGKFTPEACSDYVWNVYAKHLNSEIPLPFLMLIPPTSISVLPNVTGSGAGSNPNTRQIIFPFASDQNLKIVQLSRIAGAPSTSSLNTICTGSGISNGGNSPLCSGVVFYSVSLFKL